MLHAYTGPEVTAGAACGMTVICTATTAVLAIAQLNAGVAAPTGVSVSVEGAWTDAVPALARVALPEAVMAGICGGLPLAMPLGLL
jgi:hypothetical protein